MRRLRPLYLISLLTVLTLLATVSVSAESDYYAGSYFHPFTFDDSNSSCLEGNCDPINLIFTDQSVSQVEVALEQQGWSLTGWGSDQQLHFANDGVWQTQGIQMEFGNPFGSRYHIRLWQDPANSNFTVGGVHYETLVFLSHVIDASWEDAELFVANQLCGTVYACGSSGTLTAQEILQSADLDEDNNAGTWRGWENNLEATVFTSGSANGPPQFNSEIVNEADATVGVAYAASLADDASDPEGDPLTFSKISGPTWLTVNGDGTLSGTPQSGDVGQNSWSVAVSDDHGGTDQATLQITVLAANTPPEASFTYTCTDLICSFDASGSSDPDGIVVSYAWDFGDSASGNGVTTSHSYASGGEYSVALTVTDDDGDTGHDVQTVQVTEPTANEMHVLYIDLVVVNTGRGNKTAQATVTVADGSGAAVAGAAVSGIFSGDSNGTPIATTDADGKAILASTPVKGGSYWLFCVENVAKNDWTYNPNANAEECDAIGGDPPPSSGSLAHISNLTDASGGFDNRGRWEALVIISVHDANHGPAAGMTVSGSWSEGAKGGGSCTTGSDGTCSIAKANLKGDIPQVTFTVEGIADATGASVYDPSANEVAISIALQGP